MRCLSAFYVCTVLPVDVVIVSRSSSSFRSSTPPFSSNLEGEGAPAARPRASGCAPAVRARDGFALDLGARRARLLLERRLARVRSRAKARARRAPRRSPDGPWLIGRAGGSQGPRRARRAPGRLVFPLCTLARTLALYSAFIVFLTAPCFKDKQESIIV